MKKLIKSYIVCVVIPIHSAHPTHYELISFKQCFEILGKHDIFIVAPEGLDLTEYKQCVNDFRTIFINPKWQSTVINYNKLKLSRFFYNLFKKYKFLLTYELDAFVFKDELLYWCDKDYDYIGAPWFENFTEANANSKFIGVGNSGFSLRKISTIDSLIINAGYKDLYTSPGGGRSLLKSLLIDPFVKFYCLLSDNVLIQNQSYIMEDLFLYYSAKKIKVDYHPAPVGEAINFSFEVNPSVLFQLSKFNLPFGCHAWERYDVEFWRQHINSFGYCL